MATLVNLSGYQHGIETDETGINVTSFNVASKPEFIDPALTKAGERRGMAVGAIMSEVKIAGQVTGTAGVMAVVATTAFVPANDVDQFGQSAGGCYAISFTQNQTQTTFRDVDVSFERYAGVT